MPFHKKSAKKSAKKETTVRKKVTTADLRNALKVKVPDLGNRIGVLSAPPTVPERLRGRVERPSIACIADGLTPQQRAIRDAGTLAEHLLKEPEWQQVFQTLVTLRQGYAIIYRKLQEMCSVLHEKFEKRGEEMPLIEDFLIQYAAYQASIPFTEHQWMNYLINSMLPFLADVIDKHTEEDEKDAREEARQADEDRRNRPIPLGFKHTTGMDEPVLTRERSLVLVGYRPAVLWLIDQICTHVLAQNEGQLFTVVRFMNEAPKSKDQHRQLIRLGENAWTGCADSDKKLAICMGEYVADKLSAQPDMLIVDNLSPAYRLGFAGRPEAAVAGDAQRRFRKWCDQAGCAFIGGVCLPEKDAVDLTAPEFEQLRTFTHLRALRIIEEGDTIAPEKCRILLGTSAAFDVSKEVLESYGRTILLPANM